MKQWFEKKGKNFIPKLVVAIVVILVVLLLIAMICDLWPLFTELARNWNNEQKSVDYLKVYGAKGVPILLAIEILLAAITIIPADPIHILVGLCYGTFLGSVIAVLGIGLGSALMFLCFRQFHKFFGGIIKPNKNSWFNVEKIEKMKYPELIIVLAYVMPGLPNLIIPYIFSKTKMSFWRYIICIMLSSIPGVVLLTFSGQMLAEGNVLATVISLALLIVAILVLFFNKNKMMNKVK